VSVQKHVIDYISSYSLGLITSVILDTAQFLPLDKTFEVEKFNH